jgi:hypothetical protein
MVRSAMRFAVAALLLVCLLTMALPSSATPSHAATAPAASSHSHGSQTLTQLLSRLLHRLHIDAGWGMDPNG